MQAELRLQALVLPKQLFVLLLHNAPGLLELPRLRPVVLALLRLFLEFIVELERFFPEENELLFEEDCPVVGEHLPFLLVCLLLDGGELLLHGLDVVAIGEQELGLVLLDHLVDLFVHDLDRPQEVLVDLVGLIQQRNLLSRSHLFLRLH